MRTTVWRPRVATHKRRSNYTSLLDGAGVTSTLVFLFVFLSVQISRAMLPHQQSRDVDLAVADHSESQPHAIRERALNVYVTRDGQLYFCFTKAAKEELPQLLRSGYQRGSERKVYLRADARARYGDVKAVLDQISAAGIQNVAFITEGPPQPKH